MKKKCGKNAIFAILRCILSPRTNPFEPLYDRIRPYAPYAMTCRIRYLMRQLMQSNVYHRF